MRLRVKFHRLLSGIASLIDRELHIDNYIYCYLLVINKYRIPYLTIDHLKMGLIKGSAYCDFTALDSDEVIGEKLWPIIKGIIMTNIENNQNIIIEGCYILPEKLRDFEKEYLDNIITVFIGFSANYINENFESKIIRHRNAIESRGYEEDRPISQFIREHSELRRKCLENQAPYFEIDCDYEKDIQKAYGFIESRINERM